MLIARFAQDWRTADLEPAIEAVLAYAEKITVQPQALTQTDIEQLRSFGFTDEDIHDIVQIAAYFNYINRIADALGVPPEDFMTPWPRPNGNW